MVFNTVSLRINICHPYIILIGILLWILYFRSSHADCLTEDPENVLHVCSSSSRTNKIVHLYVDNQHVPPNLEGECSCDVAISANWKNIKILYSSSVRSYCGIEFEVLTYTFKCTSTNYAITEPFNRTTFRKTANIGGSACLSITIDHNFENTTATVTVTCHAVNAGTSTVLVLPSVSSETTTISSITNSSTGKHQPTDVTYTTHIPTSELETSMLTVGSTRKPTGDDESSDREQIGIIIGPVVGGSVVLITAVILIVCCCRKRQHKAKSTKHYINTASDHEITDNMVYNMEFPEDVKRPQVALNDMDTTYNTIDNDAHHQDKETSSFVPYTNLQLDDDGGNYNTVDLGENYQAEKIPKSVKYNNLNFSDDAGAYNSVDYDNNPNIQTETHNDTSLRPGLDTDPSSDTLGHGMDTDTLNKANSPAAEQNQTPNVTYAVVNTAKSIDNINDSGRPNQFQVAESGDTYAVVNKKSEK